MWLNKCKVIVLSVIASGLLIGILGKLSFALAGPNPNPQPQVELPKQPAAEPVKTDNAAAMVLRFSATEKPKEQQGMVLFMYVKEGGMFFSAASDNVYIQRSGGGFGGGLGAVGGFGGAFGALGGNFPQESLDVWSLATKKRIEQMSSQSAAPSPNGEGIALITQSKNKEVLRLVKTSTGKVVSEADLSKLFAGQAGLGAGGLGGFNLLLSGAALAFAPDGKRIALHTGMGLWQYDVPAGKLSRGMQIPIFSLAGYLPDGKALVGVGLPNAFGNAGGKAGDGPIVVWDLAKNAVRRSFGDASCTKAVLAPQGTMVAAFSRMGGGFGGFGVGIGMQGAAGGGFGVGGGAAGIAGAAGAAGVQGGGINLGVAGGGGALGFVGGGGAVGVGGGALGMPANNVSARLQLWDADTGKQVSTCDTKIVPEAARAKFGQNGFMAIQGGITDAAFSPDGRVLASALATAEIGHIHLWDVATGKELARVKVDFCPQAIAFSRDGSLVASAGGLGDFNLRVWDVAALTSAGARTPFDASQFPALWKDLAGDDVAKAWRAERTLSTAAPKEVVALLQANLKPLEESDDQSRAIAQLVADLDSAQFKVRDEAAKKLAQGGLAAASALRAAIKEKRSIEFQRRAETLLSKLDESAAATPEQRQQQRALIVLEQLATPESRQLLDRLANGVPEAWLTQEARAARQRIEERKAPAP